MKIFDICIHVSGGRYVVYLNQEFRQYLQTCLDGMTRSGFLCVLCMHGGDVALWIYRLWEGEASHDFESFGMEGFVLSGFLRICGVLHFHIAKTEGCKGANRRF